MRRLTETGDLIVLFDGELIVIRNLFVNTNRLFGVNDNFFVALNCNHFRVTIRLNIKTIIKISVNSIKWTYIAGVVYKSGDISASGRVYNSLQIDSKEVRAANSQFSVFFLSYVSNYWSDSLSDIFDDHFVGSDRFQSEETPIVYSTLCELQLLFAELK